MKNGEKIEVVVKRTPMTDDDKSQICVSKDTTTLEGLVCSDCKETSKGKLVAYSCELQASKMEKYIVLKTIEGDNVVGHWLEVGKLALPRELQSITATVNQATGKYAFHFFLKSEPISLGVTVGHDQWTLSENAIQVS